MRSRLGAHSRSTSGGSSIDRSWHRQHAGGKYLGGFTVGHTTEKEAKEAVEELKKVLATATYVSKKSDDAKDGKVK